MSDSTHRPGVRAIEVDFPSVELSSIAELESWRKEIHRPIYHLHKWWAQRLGSVFRAAAIAGLAPEGASVLDLFHGATRFPSSVVFDPFMGSGTTVGEAHKLGCTSVGQDINPVAVNSVRVALARLDRDRLLDLFGRLEQTVGATLRDLYRGTDEHGDPYDILYYFWVRWLTCPQCRERVDLFSTFTFARHAYPKKHPRVHVVCPDCGAVNAARYDDDVVECQVCPARFEPRKGWARGAKATCRGCHCEIAVARHGRESGAPPNHRLYAKLVLRADGTKAYLPISGADRVAYEQASARLAASELPIPDREITSGHNTRQVLNHGYVRWSDMFNRRQLYALTTLASAIRGLPECPERDALALLFSGALEFNNMFATYKGEGTGAVRHMFSHHILKPERMPIEANVWGTPKSSGAFSTLFKTRLLRAIDYQERPFELRASATAAGKAKAEKVHDLSDAIGAEVLATSVDLTDGAVHLARGDSSRTALASGSVDLVLTDPPFFDNVHYSELADFFHVWQRLYFWPDEAATTRDEAEVQDADASDFSDKLAGVFAECRRVLKDDGLLVFSYHQSRADGWVSVARAVIDAGLRFVAAHPVKAEMSVATPKSGARDPIDLDILFVCRPGPGGGSVEPEAALERAATDGREIIEAFAASGRVLSLSDVRGVLYGKLLVHLALQDASSVSSVVSGVTEALGEVAAQIRADLSK